MLAMLNLKIGIWNGWLFMSVFVLQMLVIMLADKNIQNRTHIPTEARRNKLERSISVIANIVWLSAMIYSVFLPLKLESNWFYVGFTVFVIGAVFLAAATKSFMITPVNKLITEGVYQYSRHPMYLSTSFICLGTGIATMSWIFILLSLLIAICFRQEALLEERTCLEQYGSGYRDYMERVPRWLGVPR